jgi:hypothetical protein
MSLTSAATADDDEMERLLAGVEGWLHVDEASELA